MIYSGDGTAKSVDYRSKEVYHSACGVRHRGRKSDTFHITHRGSRVARKGAGGEGDTLVLARNPFQSGRWRRVGTRVGRGLPH